MIKSLWMMVKIHVILLIVIFNSRCFSKNSWPTWELKNNPAGAHNSRLHEGTFPLYHYDIPVEKLGVGHSVAELPKKYHQELIFEKNGKRYIRWIINPEDTVYHLKVKAWLKKNDLNDQPKQLFLGHLTASRSIVVYSPDDPDRPLFSVKVSTNRTGGKWKKDKNVDLKQVKESLASSRLAKKVLEQSPSPFKTLVLLNEPAIFSLPLEGKEKASQNQGMIIRDLSPMKKNFHYLPGFSALDDKVGKDIAKKNGSSDPATFWEEHYIKPVARGSAELSAVMGLSMTSSHNQQWLIELDEQYRPTGKIFLRDFNDSHIFRHFYHSPNQFDKEFVKIMGQGKYVKNHILVQFGLFHGMPLPSWLKQSHLKKYPEVFFEEFDQHYSYMTGIPVEAFQTKKATILPPPRYSVKSYSPVVKLGLPHTKKSKEAWKTYLLFAPCLRGHDKIIIEKKSYRCEEILKTFYDMIHAGDKLKKTNNNNLNKHHLNFPCKD
jgi:hypothetical protein